MPLEVRESRRTEASPERLYAVVSDPENWPEFNEKIRAVIVDGDLILGELVFRRRVLDFAASITRRDPPSLLVATVVLKSPEGQRYDMELTYRIEPLKRGARITEIVRYDVEVPWWISMIMGLFLRWGRPTGPTNLERVEALARGAG